MEFLRNLMTQMTTLQEEEKRKVTTHKGTYGNSYQPDEDDEEKKPASGEKRGRGRPRKDADASGHVPKLSMPKNAPDWLTGGKFKAPKSDAKNTKKHTLKDWFNHTEAKMIAEDEASEKAAHADKPAEKKEKKADDKPAEKKADSKPAAKAPEKKADSKPAAKTPEKKADAKPASNFKKPNNPNRTPMDSARALAQKGMSKQGEPAKKQVDRDTAKALLKLLLKAHKEKDSQVAQEDTVIEDEGEYTTSPQRPGGMDIKDKQGDIVASAKSQQAADMFKKGDISLSAPDDIQEGNQGLTRQEKMKLNQYMKMMSGAQEFFQELEEKYELGELDEPGEPVGPFGEMAEAIANFDPGVGLREADQPTQSNDMGAGLGAGRKPEVLEGQTKITIKGLSAWKTKAESGGLSVEKVSEGMWRAINPKTGKLRGTFHTDRVPGTGSLWGNSRDKGTPAMHGVLYLDEAKKKEDPKMNKDKKPAFGGKQAAPFGKKDDKKKDAKKDDKKSDKPSWLKKKDKVNEAAEHNRQAAHHTGKGHALAGHAYSCHFDDLEEAAMYHEGYKEGLDDRHGHLPRVDAVDEPVVQDPFSAEPVRSPIGGMSSHGAFDEMAFESLDKQLNALLIDEGMTVSISKGQEGTPDSVSVNATDADSEALLAMVKSAGLGVFAADAEPEAVAGAPSDYGTSPETPVAASSPEGDIPVGNHDSMLDLIKKASGQGGGAESIAAMEIDPAQDAQSHEAVGEMETPDQAEAEVAETDAAPAQSAAPAQQAPAQSTVPDDIQEEDEVDEGHSDTAFGADAEMRAGADNDDSSQHGSGTPQHAAAPVQGDRDKPGKGDFDFTEEEEIDESLANSDDDGYEADIDFMTRVIGGGLNKEKSTGQSTIPVVADQASRLGNPMRESTDLLQDWRKLSGIK